MIAAAARALFPSPWKGEDEGEAPGCSWVPGLLDNHVGGRQGRATRSRDPNEIVRRDLARNGFRPVLETARVSELADQSVEGIQKERIPKSNQRFRLKLTKTFHLT